MIATTPEEWAALAAGESRFDWTPFVHVIDGVAHASNVHRLHWVPTDLPDGCYDPTTFAPVAWSGHVGRIDNVKALIDPERGRNFVKAFAVGFEGKPELAFYKVRTTGLAVRSSYLMDAVNGAVNPSPRGENTHNVGGDVDVWTTDAPNAVFGGVLRSEPFEKGREGRFIVHPLRV